METVNPVKKIAIVAGESSGDILGAGLIRELKKHYPDAVFEGIAGPLMQEAGCSSLFPLDELSIMGVVPILKKLPRLLSIRSQLISRWKTSPPELFIGIDAPEFNLGLAQKLKKEYIKTIHYVSPSIWAWRPKRIFKIEKSIDLMLCLFPFEQDVYKKHHIDNVCVGHSLADQIPLENDKQAARKTLNLDSNASYLCLMPGSRGSELNFLADDFIETAKLVEKAYPKMKFIAPMANEQRAVQFKQMLEQHLDAPDMEIIYGRSREAMIASDIILMASGTATLEAMLIKRPMVVAYKVGNLSYKIFKKMLVIDTFALPNLLSKENIVPEAIQEDCTPDVLFSEIKGWLEAPQERWQTTLDIFNHWHLALKKDADKTAASSIAEWYSRQNVFSKNNNGDG